MASNTPSVPWPNVLRMTKARAEQIREWRTPDDGLSWRAVASAASEKWNGEWGSNQLAGMELCERAARYFGENYMEPPWN